MTKVPEWKFEIWADAQANNRAAVREAIVWLDKRGRETGFARPDGAITKDFEEAFRAWKEMNR